MVKQRWVYVGRAVGRVLCCTFSVLLTGVGKDSAAGDFKFLYWKLHILCDANLLLSLGKETHRRTQRPMFAYTAHGHAHALVIPYARNYKQRQSAGKTVGGGKVKLCRKFRHIRMCRVVVVVVAAAAVLRSLWNYTSNAGRQTNWTLFAGSCSCVCLIACASYLHGKPRAVCVVWVWRPTEPAENRNKTTTPTQRRRILKWNKCNLGVHRSRASRLWWISNANAIGARASLTHIEAV